MRIKVITLTGHTIELNTDLDDTIYRVKEYVEEKEGIPQSQQRLVFGGRLLSDERTLQSYDVTGGSTVHLVLALRGGF